MNCNECQELLSDYVDGEMELGAQTKIELHLANCEPCRAVRDDLLQIVHFSRQLPLHTPAAAVWTRIQEQIEEEQPKTFSARLKAWWGRVHARDFSLTLPQMAVVATAFIVMATIGTVVFRNSQSDNLQSANSPNQFAQGPRSELSGQDQVEIQELEKQIDELKGTVEARKPSWSPDLRMTFDKNMLHVDQLLSEVRQEFSSNPRDENCKALLRNAYDEKIRLLAGFVNF